MGQMRQFLLFVGISVLAISSVHLNQVSADKSAESEDDIVQIEPIHPEDDAYVTPPRPGKAYIAETFDSPDSLGQKWIISKAKKPDVEEDIAQYVGQWSIEPQQLHPLQGDSGLVQKSKAKHHAISAHLDKTYNFNNVPFIIQYEVMFQDKHDCGGAYLKLLTEGPALKDLTTFNDKTPYTIMFGPDKCGTDDKVHFIIRHRNPLNGTVTEKHHKPIKPSVNLYTNESPHLYTLALYPDNKYAVYIDNELNIEGHLLDEGTFEPPINPPKEIVDVNDKKPSTWDEREKIPDPEATKPEDWDESEAYEIEDVEAMKPDGWLVDEPKLIPDPSAVKPADWDDEMDGEWEAPQIENPLCVDAPGCGPWSAPLVKNPKFRGKWSAPMINNPNYNGKWTPRMIPNPDYYHDAQPFKLFSIGAVGIEIWTMSENIYFDNILITESLKEAHDFAEATFKQKLLKRTNDKSFLSAAIKYTQENPWLWAVYVMVAGLIVVISYVLCCSTSGKEDNYPSNLTSSTSKKTDEPSPDDEVEETTVQDEEEEEVEGKEEEDEGEGEESGGEEDEENEGEEEEEEGAEEEEIETEQITTSTNNKKNSGSKNNKKPSKENSDSAPSPPAQSSPRKRRSRRE
uniref:Calmegin n=1 Tax=Cacopsylla melanoneura TaxID=428564 RepID=A0A8D9AA20_9HEMI